MEDYARELEKEIKDHLQPTHVKQKIKSRLFFMDDFGTIKSASWVKVVVWLMSFVALVSAGAAFLFYYLYTDLKRENRDLTGALEISEKKVKSLVNEKELLLARMVIAGKSVADFVKEEPEKIKDEQKKSIEPATKKQKKPESVKPEKTATGKQGKPESVKQGSVVQKKSAQIEKEDKKYEKIEVEAFMVEKDRVNNDLLVRFDIRNVSDNIKNISGRVFVLLKPDLYNAANWLCLPSVPLKAGKPGVPKKGQYFSIAHFKPVKFRVKSNLDSDVFKFATIFVYDDNEEIMFTRNIIVQSNRE